MISPNQLAEVVVKTITGRDVCLPKVININSKQLCSRGDLSFQVKLDYWRGYVDIKSDWFKNSENILQYFQHRCLNGEVSNLSDDQILEILEKNVSQLMEYVAE